MVKKVIFRDKKPNISLLNSLNERLWGFLSLEERSLERASGTKVSKSDLLIILGNVAKFKSSV